MLVKRAANEILRDYHVTIPDGDALRGLEHERINNKNAWTIGQPMRKLETKGNSKGNLGENLCMIITHCDTFGALSKREQPIKMLEPEHSQ